MPAPLESMVMGSWINRALVEADKSVLNYLLRALLVSTEQ
jgi:hypothetical protein